MGCLRAYFTRAQTCDNVRVQSATQSSSKCYTIDCFGSYFHAQTCDNIRVQSATQWAAWVHILHMLKPVITFVFEVLHTGLLEHSKKSNDTAKVKKAWKDCVWSANVPVCTYLYIYILLSQILNISFQTLSNQLDGFLLGSGPCLSNQAKGAYIQMCNTHEAQPQDESCRISHVSLPP